MQIAPVIDSRRFDRIERKCEFVGRHCDFKGDIRLFSGKTLDISLRGLGMMIDSRDVPAEGDTVDISIRISENEPAIKVVGYVSWRSDEVDDFVGADARLGVELTGMVNPVKSYKRWLEILTWN